MFQGSARKTVEESPKRPPPCHRLTSQKLTFSSLSFFFRFSGARFSFGVVFFQLSLRFVRFLPSFSIFICLWTFFLLFSSLCRFFFLCLPFFVFLWEMPLLDNAPRFSKPFSPRFTVSGQNLSSFRFIRFCSFFWIRLFCWNRNSCSSFVWSVYVSSWTCLSQSFFRFSIHFVRFV